MSENNDYYVFFDVDNTLISIRSMFSFLKYLKCKRYRYTGFLRYNIFRFMTNVYENLGWSREWLNKRYYRNFKGLNTYYVQQVAKEWFQSIQDRPDLFHLNILGELKMHQKKGAKVILVSGSFLPCILPIAEKCKASHILATQITSVKNVYSGTIILPQTIGKGKVDAIRNFLQPLSFDALKKCYAYGDHISDLPMLLLVGNPRVVAGDAELEDYALKNNWPIIQPV